MNGMITQQMGHGSPMDAAPPPTGAAKPQPPENPTEERGEGESGGFMSGVEKSIPPELMEAFERVVLAGKKVIYSPEMENAIKQEIAREGPIEKKLAEAIVGLMAILDKQSRPRIPVPVLIPAAIELVYDAADFVQQAGLVQEEITPDQVKTASQLTAMLIAKRYGANDQQIGQMMRGQVKQPGGANGGV